MPEKPRGPSIVSCEPIHAGSWIWISEKTPSRQLVNRGNPSRLFDQTLDTFLASDPSVPSTSSKDTSSLSLRFSSSPAARSSRRTKAMGPPSSTLMNPWPVPLLYQCTLPRVKDEPPVKLCSASYSHPCLTPSTSFGDENTTRFGKAASDALSFREDYSS